MAGRRKPKLLPEDLARLDEATRVWIDSLLEHGFEIDTVGHAQCAKLLHRATSRLADYTLSTRDGEESFWTPCQSFRRRAQERGFDMVEQWDGRTQQFFPKHYKYVPVNFSSFNAMFKELYSPDRIQNLAHGRNPILGLVPRSAP